MKRTVGMYLNLSARHCQVPQQRREDDTALLLLLLRLILDSLSTGLGKDGYLFHV